jgi:hypothetical protein
MSRSADVGAVGVKVCLERLLHFAKSFRHGSWGVG